LLCLVSVPIKLYRHKLFSMKTLLAVIGGFTLGLATILYQNKPLEKSIEDGAEIYQDFCLQCHLESGQGVSGVFPPLAGSDYLLDNIDRSIRGIKYGLSGTIVVNDEEYNGIMQNQGLENLEIADVMNYILNNWGNQSDEIITAQRVSAIKE
jgi:mono/diheme cytochrome c family protein